MTIDPELLKQLIESFSTELDEHTQVITTSLLALEKNALSEEERNKRITSIFRSSHNIKGTSRSLGIIDLGEIAHQLESTFSEIQKKTLEITPEIISSSLKSVDKMREAFKSFIQKEPENSNTNQPVQQEFHEHDSIRIPIHKIEKISSLLEEIQANRIALVEEINISNQDMNKDMHSHVNELSILFHSLQDEVASLRMTPMGNLLCTFPRYVRDLAHELNKKIELTVKGEEVKVDKAILEGLKDPLFHLLRNAIDHGIETADIRQQSGKPEAGHIIIEIKEEESQIKISMSDDGAGIDLQKLIESAEQKGITTTNMSESEKLALIFRSGFSTKKIITDVSGRGVGLDVVKSNIENLRGHLDFSTTLGKGTTFILRVPLSIASERGLVVKCEQHHFVIPTHVVERVLALDINQVVSVQGSQAIVLENRTILLRKLTDILHLKENNNFNGQKLSIVIIQKANTMLALLVDEIVGEREIVIKALQKPLTKTACIAGGTLIESNEVVVVLNPNDLIDQALQHANINRITSKEEITEKDKRPHILVVDDSITTRTLEKNVLESKNYQVTVAVNGKEAWDILQKQKFSLLITDVCMPIMDGFTLTEQVKKHDKLRDLPVIIVTSLGSDVEKKKGIDVGADAYIVKNEFESGALLEVVSQLV